MDATPADPVSPLLVVPEPTTAAVLVVQNGRLSGVRRPLGHATTLLGCAEGCDIRLNVDSVRPWHCVLTRTPAGFEVRDLGTEGGTALNGSPITRAAVRDGDQLTVGPFSFRFESARGDESASTGAPIVPGPAEYTHVKDSLRVQAAAVVAQQAALMDDEVRLNERRAILEQQETQLASHLEEKRRRLLEVRDEARAARELLHAERHAHEAFVEQSTAELAAGWREVAGGTRQVERAKQRLFDLRKRLKQRWYKLWAGERTRLKLEQAELDQLRHDHDRNAERLQRERDAFQQIRARFTSETELERRQLQHRADELRQERHEFEALRIRSGVLAQERAAQVELQITALNELSRQNQTQLLAFESKRSELQLELDGLETRIRNQRVKIQEPSSQLLVSAPPRPTSVGLLHSHSLVAPADAPVEPYALEQRTVALQQLADDLADQRWHLLEQSNRFLEARQNWESDRVSTLAELEVLGLQLQDREEQLQEAEQALEQSEARLADEQRSFAVQFRTFEGTRARLTVQHALVETECDRRLGEVRAREEQVERRWTLLTELRERWLYRRRLQLERLRAERSQCDALRVEWATLRDAWVRMGGQLDADRRSWAEQLLALEDMRTELLGRAADPAAAERRLERLRERWHQFTEEAARALATERATFLEDANRFGAREYELDRYARELDESDSLLTDRLTAWEQREAALELEYVRFRQQAQVAQEQRDQLERALHTVRAEVERLALVLLDEADTPRQAVAA